MPTLPAPFHEMPHYVIWRQGRWALFACLISLEAQACGPAGKFKLIYTVNWTDTCSSLDFPSVSDWSDHWPHMPLMPLKLNHLSCWSNKKLNTGTDCLTRRWLHNPRWRLWGSGGRRETSRCCFVGWYLIRAKRVHTILPQSQRVSPEGAALERLHAGASLLSSWQQELKSDAFHQIFKMQSSQLTGHCLHSWQSDCGHNIPHSPRPCLL